MIHLKSTAKLAKSFSVKREKTDDDSEHVVAHLKIADCLVDRDQLDELLGLPKGWSTGALYDDFGAPLSRLTLSVARRELLFTGVLRGGEKSMDPKLKLKDAEISGITLELTKLGALLGCQMSWAAAGDEVDDIADMLGTICALDAVFSSSGQQDLLGVVTAVKQLQKIAERDGTAMTLSDGAGNEIGTIAPQAGRITSFNAAMRLIESGYHLRGASPDYWVEKPDGSDRRSLWLNAAKSCLKAGVLEPIGDGDTDEVGRWKLRSAA
jgi:hypothetical protein